MSNPCAAPNIVEPQDFHRFQRRKLWFLLLPLLLLIPLLLRACDTESFTAPEWTAIPSGEVAPGSVTLRGTADPNANVEVFLNGQSIGTTQAEANGNFSLATDDLDAGLYSAVAQVSDENGRVRAVSPAGSWRVAAAGALAAPTLTLPDGAPAGAVRLSGTGTPGTTVEVFRNGVSIGTADVNAAGKWELITSVDSYDNEFEAVGFSADGAEIGRTGLMNLAIPGAAAALAVAAPQFADGNFSWGGRGEPGSTVELFANGASLGTTTVGADGTWSFGGALEPGDYDLSARMTHPDGTMLGERGRSLVVSAEPVVFEPGPPTMDKPEGSGAITLTGTGFPGSTVEILRNGESIGTATVGDDGIWTFDTEADRYLNDYQAVGTAANGDPLGRSRTTRLIVPGAAAALGFAGAPVAGAAAPLTWSGTGEPGSTVEIFANGESIGTTTVGPDGTWNFESGTALPAGDYDLTATMTAPDGTVIGTSDSNALSVAEAPLSGVTGLVGGTSAADPVTITGMGNPGETIEILVNGEVVGTTTADENGNWSFPYAFPAGNYTVSSRNADGVESAQLPFTQGENGIGANISLIDVDGENFTVTGVAPAGSEVEIWVDGALVGTTTADENGNWTYSGTAPAGAHTIQARTVQDGIGLGGFSRSFATGDGSPAISVDTITGDDPNAPVTFRGSASPNALVELFVDGVSVGTITADADGNWELANVTTAGAHTVEAREIDPNTGALIVASNIAPFFLDRDGVVGTETGILKVVFAGTADPETGELLLAEDGFIADAPAVSLIVDASWSMTFPLDSSNEADRLTADDPNSRIGVAKDSIADLLEIVPEGSPFAIRAFGNLRGNLECQTDLMQPLQPFDRGAAQGVIDGIFPQFNANTTIAASLDAIPSDLAGTDRPQTVILLTDGQETCGGDPVASAQALADAGIDVKVNVVGFAIDDDALKAQFEEVATITGGSYFDAQDQAGLSEALGATIGAPIRVIDSSGNIVATGFVGSEIAVPAGDYTVEIDADGSTTTVDATVNTGRINIVEVE